jgi:hypothetical protein
MNKIDSITILYKAVQQKHLPVYVETVDNKIWHVTTKDHLLSLHNFRSRESAVEFCKYLDLKILAFVVHKDLDEGIFE